MKEMHCKDCNRFLCKLGFGEIIIKCPNTRCKKINRLRLDTYTSLLTAKLDKDSIKV